MAVKFCNNFASTLSSGINSSATTISVASAAGLPSLSGNDYLYLTIDTDTGSPTREIVKVTAISSNDLTVVRGQDGTSATSFDAGTKIELRVTAAALHESVSKAVDDLVDSAPGALDTLNELAAALGDDANFSTTVTNSIATKVPLAGGTMTGNLTVPNLSVTSTNWLGWGDYGERIIGSNAHGTLTFQTDATTALQLDSSQNASFSGNVDATGVIKVGTYAAAQLKVNGYGGGTYRSIMLGAPDNNGGSVALAVDVSAFPNTASNFAGKDVAFIGKNGLIFPNADADNWIGGIARGSSSDVIHVGPATSGGVSSGPLTLTSTEAGIGLTSPTSPLTVKSDSTSSSDSGITLQGNGNTNAIFKVGEKSTDGGRLHMYDGGTEKIAFYTDGTANHISAGNLGIGTSSPGNIVEVAGASPVVEINATSGNPELQFSDGGTDEFSMYYDTGANAFKFVEGGVGTRLTIADGGDVEFAGDIGLGVAGSSFGSGTPTINFKGTSSAYAARAGALRFKGNDGDDVAALYVTDGSDGHGTVLCAYQGPIRFSTGTLSDNRLTISSAGDAVFSGTVTSSSTSGAATFVAYRNQTTLPNSGDGANLIGAYLFQSSDSSGSEPHYAGIGGFSDQYGRMELQFFTERDNWDSDPRVPTLTLDRNKDATLAGNLTLGDGHTIGNDVDNNLALTSSANENLMLDSAHGIYLDHGTSSTDSVYLRQAGSSYAYFRNSSDDLVIGPLGEDHDIFFQGNDGGSTINMLRLDASEYGYATFSGHAELGGKLTVSTTMDGVGAPAAGTGILGATAAYGAILTGQGSTNDITISNDAGQSALAVPTGTRDVVFSGHIELADSKYVKLGADADFIIYHDGTSNYVQAAKQDSDIIFRGNDGGTGTNMLTLDTSAAGEATFNAGATFGDTVQFDKLVTGGFGATSTSGTLDFDHLTNSRPGMGYTLLQGGDTSGPDLEDGLASAGGGAYYYTMNYEYSTKDGSGSITQIAIPYARSTNSNVSYNKSALALRTRYSGTWSSWARYLYLDVATSTAQVDGNLGIESNGAVSLGSTDVVLQVGSSSHSTPTIQIRSGTSGKGQLWFGDNSGTDVGRYDGYIEYDQSGRDFRIGTACTERIRIDSSGNVGIGVTNPSDYYAKDLVVTGPSEGGITIAATGDHTNYLLFADSTSGVARYAGMVGYSHPNDEMSFRTNSIQRMVIDSNGDVGIGSTNPDGVLDLGNGTAGRGIVWGGTTGANNYGGIWSEYGSASIIIGAGLKSPYPTANAGFRVPYTGTYGYAAIELDSWSDDGIKFYVGPDAAVTKDDVITPTEVMRLSTNGRLGLGTTSPSSLLHLASASSPTLRIVDTTNDATLLAYAQDSEAIIGTYSGHNLGLFTDSGRTLTLDTSHNATFAGNVDIDGGILEVGGSVSSYGRIEAYGSSGGYIDLTANTAHSTDDYDARFIYGSGFAQITSKSGHLDLHPQAGLTYVRHHGSISLETTSDGVKVRDNSGADTAVHFNDSSDGALGRLYANSTGGEFRFDSYMHGAAFAFRGEDGDGSVNSTIWADPDSDVWLYYDGGWKFRTASDGVLINGSISYNSDRRLKKDITPISGALDAVMSLQGVNYTLIDSDTKHIGFIAQDIQAAAPAWLSERVVVESTVDDETAKRRGIIRDDESVEMLSLKYTEMVALLTEAMKEQQVQIEALTKRIKELEDA